MPVDGVTMKMEQKNTSMKSQESMDLMDFFLQG